MADRLFGGRYRVTGTLGHGGMASVYRAVDEQLGREVAVKVFRIGAVDHGERARAEAEMHTLAALRSPALVTLYDAALDDVDGDSYLVMELVPGSDLDTRLREGPLDPGTTARVGSQVADGLAAVHAQGIVHRDVKPANVLLESDGEHVKLADFGIALLRDAARVTGTGTVIGTAAYISPEQVTGREVTGKADVYALGLVLLQCLTGERPFPGSAVESATARLTRGPEIDQHLPTAWRTLLHVMTAQDPAERPTAAEAAQRLRALGRDDAAPATQLLPGGPGTMTRAAAGAAGAAAGAALGFGADPAHGDAATQAMATPGAPDTATRAYDRTAVLGQSGAGRPAGAGSGGQDDVATTILGTQGSRGGAAAAGAGAGAGAAGGAAGGRGAGGAGRDTDGSGRRRGLVIAAVVVGLLVLAGIGFALFASGRDGSTPAPTESSQPASPSSEPTSGTDDEPSEPAEQQPSEPEEQPSEPAQQEPSEPAQQEPSQPADDPTVGPQPGGPASNPVQAPQGGTGTGPGSGGPGATGGKGKDKGAGAVDTTSDKRTRTGTDTGAVTGTESVAVPTTAPAIG
ncbi:serine/threonine-protein kinase [Curtobacterium sp. UCD-KPL2560]|uniref:serine/threonine-protein kinase n=1 Tax=Curtobacterium sp. UCD-KPL2560 TaxID=1885315 RepID=UPI0009F41E73|nr:serine/threonine-protein kinase [Curtobacterium sp. UCD-KPL2560]